MDLNIQSDTLFCSKSYPRNLWGPVVRYGDQQWSDIVRWTVYVLFLAEELGITSENIEDFKEHKNPTIQRFMGELNGKEDAYLGTPSWD